MIDISIVKDSPAYVIVDGTLLLDAPVEAAWPCVVDYPSWQDFSGIERISGAVGEEGEVFYLTKVEEGFEFPPYYARTLKVEHESHIVWKTFAADVPEGTGFFGVVQFWVGPAGDAQTRFRYQLLYEFDGPFASEAEREAFTRDKYEDFATLWASIGPKLQKLVISRSAAVEAS
jgi:hypothetical protein